MSETFDLTDLDAGEATAACLAVAEFRKERRRLAEEAALRGTPTWKNTLQSNARVGYQALYEHAGELGYTFYVWNGRVYATDLPIIADTVCLAESLDNI